LGDNVPAKLGYRPCWTNKGKDENELGTFLYKAFVYNQARKGIWHSNLGLFVCTAEDSKEFVGYSKRQAIYKSRHTADLSHYHFNNLNLS